MIRPPRGDDKAALLRLADNRAVWRNLTHRFTHPYTEADADAWFSMLGKSTMPTHWAIDVGGEAVGGIGVRIGEGVFAKSAEFGYWLGEPFWGRGIMTAAVSAIADHAFSPLGFKRIETPVFAWNPASMRVLEKCGFVREGVMAKSVFKDGELIDSMLYARVVP